MAPMRVLPATCFKCLQLHSYHMSRVCLLPLHRTSPQQQQLGRRLTLLQATGMAVLLNDAVDQAERLAGENKELRRKQEDAVLDKCVGPERTRNLKSEKLRPLHGCYAVILAARLPLSCRSITVANAAAGS